MTLRNSAPTLPSCLAETALPLALGLANSRCIGKALGCNGRLLVVTELSLSLAQRDLLLLLPRASAQAEIAS
jgi:hypothetical protein